ncbi:PIR Superfamily Protein [Plasmodium ovale wallikeri]|uniref:PIR Superfamily Protein n=1 Tax=Plasmodium ovale wallikeri TaxID=864142 RepID=A0A1A9AJN5_PLAOA|nr:PIR Superfamily Protein [Plasmodium ovale wallikeri]SBT56379.1 PIR Superfamily Protein [Plasmodium ovale wallikeri]
MTDNGKHLKDVPSIGFDVMMNNPIHACELCSHCENTVLKLNNDYWFKIFCYKFARNIQTLYEILVFRSELKKKRCDDLHYWVHDQVINTYNYADFSRNYVNVVADIKKVWNDINEKSKYSKYKTICETNFSSLNFTEMSRRKKIDDYCENYNELYNILTRRRQNCNIYYEYFKKKSIEYDELLKGCLIEGADRDYCSKICKIDVNSRNNIMNTTKCKTTEEAQKQNDVITQKQCEAQKQELQSQFARISSVSSSQVLSFSDHRIIFLVIFTVWGIFLTLLFLYKISPFGTWIKNIFQKKKNLGVNFDGENENELFDNYSENLNSNFRNVEYNVPYNSNWNSSR